MNKQNKIFIYSTGKLLWRNKEYKCAIGRGGFSSFKKEGDGATPIGQFLIREVYYRQDRLDKPKTILPLKVITSNDGWCDDIKDKAYNRLIKLPYSASYENLQREDHVYDLIITIGHNDSPPIPGEGSAIFIHIARAGYTPTEGCIVLSLEDLLEILETVDEHTLVCIEKD